MQGCTEIEATTRDLAGCTLGWVEKSKVGKNILGHVDPIEIHKNKDILPYTFV